MPTQQDKAGRAYWERVWAGQSIPGAIDPQVNSLKNHVYRCFHEYFVRVLDGPNQQGRSLLEVGCARSRWLPYFVEEFGVHVTGIDYSEIGCEQAKAILDRAGVDGTVVCADFNVPPMDMLGAYDIVVSFGVVEHFEDTAACLSTIRRFLKPNGLMITLIPNMAGGVGWLQKHLCWSIYDVHIPMDRRGLRLAHERADLSVHSCDYFVNVHWGVVNLTCWEKCAFYRAARLLLLGFSAPFWFLERKGLILRPNRWMSPYVMCVSYNTVT